MSFLWFAWISLPKKNHYNNDKNVEKKNPVHTQLRKWNRESDPSPGFFKFFLKLIEEAQEGRVPERP